MGNFDESPLLEPDAAEIDRRRFFLVNFNGSSNSNTKSNFYDKKCIILDLDQTLICTANDKRLFLDLSFFDNASLSDLRRRSYYFHTLDPIKEVGRGLIYEHYGIRRPYLDEFINWCFETFDVVAVWSAGRQKYVENICEQIFRGDHRPHIIWSFDNCKQEIIEGKLYTTKPLQRMIYSDEGQALGMSLENSFLLDDRSDVCVENPLNCIQIPIYNPFEDENEEKIPYKNIEEFRTYDNRDKCLLQFMSWMEREMIFLFRSATDIRKFIREHLEEIPWK